MCLINTQEGRDNTVVDQVWSGQCSSMQVTFEQRLLHNRDVGQAWVYSAVFLAFPAFFTVGLPFSVIIGTVPCAAPFT